MRPALRVIAVDGPSIAQDLAIPAMQTFGGVLHDLHGPSVVKLNGRWVTLEQELPCHRARRRRSALSARWTPSF